MNIDNSSDDIARLHEQIARLEAERDALQQVIMGLLPRLAQAEIERRLFDFKPEFEAQFTFTEQDIRDALKRVAGYDQNPFGVPTPSATP